jgi:hypothetical protein
MAEGKGMRRSRQSVRGGEPDTTEEWGKIGKACKDGLIRATNHPISEFITIRVLCMETRKLTLWPRNPIGCCTWSGRKHPYKINSVPFNIKHVYVYIVPFVNKRKHFSTTSSPPSMEPFLNWVNTNQQRKSITDTSAIYHYPESIKQWTSVQANGLGWWLPTWRWASWGADARSCDDEAQSLFSAYPAAML